MPAEARGGRQGRLSRHARALDEQVDSLEQPFLLRPEVDFDTRCGKPAGVDAELAVDRDGRDAAPGERERGRLSGPGEPEDERSVRQLHGFRAVTKACGQRAGTVRSLRNAASRSTSSGANASRQRSSSVGRPGAPTWLR